MSRFKLILKDGGIKSMEKKFEEFEEIDDFITELKKKYK
jgi:hypothetical protein